MLIFYNAVCFKPGSKDLSIIRNWAETAPHYSAGLLLFCQLGIPIFLPEDYSYVWFLMKPADSFGLSICFNTFLKKSFQTREIKDSADIFQEKEMRVKGNTRTSSIGALLASFSINLWHQPFN